MKIDEIESMTATELRKEAAKLVKRGHKFDARAPKSELIESIREALAAEEVIQSAQSAPTKPAPPEAAEEVVQWYRVKGPARYVLGGISYHVAADSKVNQLTHDLASMREQGVPLEPCESPEV